MPATTTRLRPPFAPDGLARPRAGRTGAVLVALAHGIGVWLLVQATAGFETAAALKPLSVVWVTAAPVPPAPEPPAPPLPRPTTPQAPRLPLPTVELAAPAPEPPRPTVADAAPAPRPPVPAPAAAPTAPPAPAVFAATAPAPPRQVDIRSVSYLTPPVLHYPPASRRMQEQGRVEVHVLVDTQGLPREARLIRSSGHPRLDEAALAAVRATRFKPYAQDGVPQPFWVVMPLIFELET